MKWAYHGKMNVKQSLVNILASEVEGPCEGPCIRS